MADFATESGHWYRPDGTPCYSIVGKNGKERNTTLRDAKALNLYYSVTTIIRSAAAPQLERWKRNQVLLSALTLPRIVDESEATWLDRVERDWQEQGRRAADRGSEIHGAIEHFYRTGETGEYYAQHVIGARDCLEANCGPSHWLPERSFAHPNGYGGKVDLHSWGWVTDFKTKEFTEEGAATLTTYDEHAMQLAAYRRGLRVPHASCGILYVSVSVPGLCRFIEIDEAELVRGLAMFDGLHSYLIAKTGYRPVALEAAA